MPKLSSLIIEPPEATRKSSSSANPDVVLQMVSEIGPEAWVWDGKVYATAKAAEQEAGVYRRALPKALGMDAHKLKSKIWGTDKDGKVVTDREKPADWRFAFQTDPNRQKREQKPKAAAA